MKPINRAIALVLIPVFFSTTLFAIGSKKRFTQEQWESHRRILAKLGRSPYAEHRLSQIRAKLYNAKNPPQKQPGFLTKASHTAFIILVATAIKLVEIQIKEAYVRDEKVDPPLLARITWEVSKSLLDSGRTWFSIFGTYVVKIKAYMGFIIGNTYTRILQHIA